MQCVTINLECQTIIDGLSSNPIKNLRKMTKTCLYIYSKITYWVRKLNQAEINMVRKPIASKEML